tara:strand:+ start:3123 stop:3641 length:519 start_codon:yes stop_codon:yes gene_type:complete
MVHNTTWLVLFVWLLCTVSVNAHWHQPDGVGNGNRWESTVSDERIISPELAWWYFDTDWDIGFGIHESDWAADDWWQSNRYRDLFGDIELSDRELFKLDHDPSFDWHRCYKPCVVVCHGKGCFENWQRSKRFGERKMIDEKMLFCIVGFIGGVVCHRFVMAGLSKAFGWINK